MAIILTSTTLWAVDVETVAGRLADDVTDATTTELTLHGTIDARDFRFIADSLTQLTTIDLSGVEIVAYRADKPTFGTQTDFEQGELPQQAFFGSKLANITLPTTIKVIGQAAFAGCEQLQTIILPEGLTAIEPYAFSGSGLTTVDVPATVANMGIGAFANCPQLAQATLNCPVIGERAFMGDAALESLTLGEAVTVIADEAFLNTAITGINLSTLPALKQVGTLAFASTALATAALPQQGVAVGDGALFNNALLTQANLPDDMEQVPAYVMAGNEALVFSHIIPSQTQSIGDYAFYNCAADVDTLHIPASVNYLGTRAMAGAIGMKNIFVAPTTVPQLGENVWEGVNQSIVNLDTREGDGNDIADLYGEAEQWKEFHILHNYLLGDANTDGEISVADITAITNHMMEEESDHFDAILADVNQDNEIGIADITAVVNILLEEREITVIRRAPAHNSNVAGELLLDDLHIKPGTQQVIAMSLNNEVALTAMQCDVVLPQGLRIVAVNGTNRTTGHHFTTASFNNITRILVTSDTNELMDGNSGEIALLTIEADETTTGDIEVRNACAADPRATAHRLAGTSAQTGTVTAVDEITDAQARVFTRNQTLVIDAPSHATAQVVAVNGTSTSLQLQPGRNETQLSAGVYVVVIEGKGHKIVIP
ncbi:MAG: leucine-rich repeat protein [Muribaculaceae bacterium]|nr:leucine-rich repeat protein [Muribaculaceae bacterium]